MKIKVYTLLLALVATFATSCKKNLDEPPRNILSEEEVFKSAAGVEAYIARIYSQLPIEDFKYQQTSGFKTFFFGSPYQATGEAISRDINNTTETFNYWADAYALIRDCHIIMETLPKYASNFNAEQVKFWLAEARFVRGMTYYALVKRYGGVPLVDKQLTQTGQTIDDIVANMASYRIPRSSEQAVYDFIAADLDNAANNLPDNIATTKKGRVTKWAALAFKSRIMLNAACVAKYNTINLTAGGAQVCGIPANKATEYFKAAYDAATQLIGKYSLYKNGWSATDKIAQANNYAAAFLDPSSAENIFVRQYKVPDAAHWYDANQIPTQLWNGGYSAETNPTLEFVEMFEGLPRNAAGGFQSVDAANKYILWNTPGEPFANVEPRLKGIVLFPGDPFKNQIIDLRRGIYTGPVVGGITKLVGSNSTNAYPTTNLVTSVNYTQTPVTLPDGSKMEPAGKSGFFTNISGVAGGISGFTIRKFLDPNKPTAEINNNRSDQAWIEMRYAEVLLNQAEAAYELFDAGQGATYLPVVLTNLNLIRERGGATLATLADLTTVDVVRKERRKEMAFENKTWWDLRRWRIIDKEQNGKIYHILNGFYSSQAAKYFYDDRYNERATTMTFDPRWYYAQIPTAVINKSPNIAQNPGY